MIELLALQLALRGYSHLGGVYDAVRATSDSGDALFQRLAERAVEMAVSGLDHPIDRNEQLAIEGVTTLTGLVFVIKQPTLNSILTKLLLKVRSCFDKVRTRFFQLNSQLRFSPQDNAALRAASFALFGQLSLRVGAGEAFCESLRASTLPLLLHIQVSGWWVCSPIHPSRSFVARTLKHKKLSNAQFGAWAWQSNKRQLTVFIASIAFQ